LTKPVSPTSLYLDEEKLSPTTARSFDSASYAAQFDQGLPLFTSKQYPNQSFTISSQSSLHSPPPTSTHGDSMPSTSRHLDDHLDQAYIVLPVTPQSGRTDSGDPDDRSSFARSVHTHLERIASQPQ